ncbi:hypothetical protein BD410DRAFT_154134 [Rickenella mellea]|uniref:F-box domain-containing protein n=1 Tax=Rickenella mellea TaxID=50990 RepID=A0A4Y7PHK8_9AGAM|nr:hypothetical protein BD410DRAFT_154134 [Rickenella mellea]
MHVTKLTISLHRAPSVDAYQVLHDSLSAIFSLRSLTMIISGWGQRTTSEAKIVLPNLEELAIETLKGHIIDDTEGFLMACGAFDCVSLKTFQAPICTCYREVGWGRPSEPNSWSNMESLANQVHFSYPRISELSLLSQNYTVGRFGWNEKTNDRGLSTFLWSLARPCTELEGEWLFPAMTHLTITLDYSHVSQALETLIILCRTRRNNGKTLPLRIIELHGVSGDAGDQDVIDQLSFLVHDVIVRY